MHALPKLIFRYACPGTSPERRIYSLLSQILVKIVAASRNMCVNEYQKQLAGLQEPQMTLHVWALCLSLLAP